MTTRDLKTKAKEILRRGYHRVLVQEQDGRFSAMLLEFAGCYSMGDTAAQAARNLETAAQLWLMAVLPHTNKFPKPMRRGVGKLHTEARRCFDRLNPAARKRRKQKS